VQSPPKQFVHHQNHPSLTLNMQNMNPQYMDHRPQLSLRGPEQSPFNFGFELHLEKQNRMLAQLMGSIAKQEHLEKQRLQMDMNQKIRELQMDKLKVEIELEKQKAKRAQGMEETPKKIPPRKEPSSLEKVVMSLMVKKTRSHGFQAKTETFNQELPLISERHYGEQEDSLPELQEEPEAMTPQRPKKTCSH